MKTAALPDAVPAEVIADIYEAAVDDACWPNIGGIVAKAAGVETGGVWFIDQGQVRDLSLTADLTATQRPYLAHYFKQDLWTQGHMKCSWEQVHVGYELCSERELVKTEFYNDFARRYGLFRPMGAMMRLARGTFANISLNQPGASKLFEEEDKRRLGRLLPHLRRALQLRHARRIDAARAPLHAAALDALVFGIVICDASSGITFANQAAERLANAGAGIVFGGRQNGLGAVVPAQARVLAALIHDAAQGGAGGIVRLTGDFPSVVALVTPLPRSLAADAAVAPRYALVTLRSPWDSPSFSTETLIALFGLSPAQAAIAFAIFNGKSPDEIAAERGVSIATLRSQLAEVFTRTGAENQRELVRMLGMLPPVNLRSDRFKA